MLDVEEMQEGSEVQSGETRLGIETPQKCSNIYIALMGDQLYVS
jgi:hypothetical protein